jgi:hypothetical protein
LRIELKILDPEFGGNSHILCTKVMVEIYPISTGNWNISILMIDDKICETLKSATVKGEEPPADPSMLELSTDCLLV